MNCKNCGAEISMYAQVCPKCGNPIVETAKGTLAKSPWYYSGWFIVLMIFIAPPIGVILTWMQKPPGKILGRKPVKILVTVYCIIAFFIYIGQKAGKKEKSVSPSTALSQQTAMPMESPPTPSNVEPSSGTTRHSTSGSSGGMMISTTQEIGKSWKNPIPKGKTAVVAGLETKVMGAIMKKSISKDFLRHQAGEGATLLIVKYTVKNITKEPIQAISFADAVIDKNGTSYEPSMDCAMVVNTLGITDMLNPNLEKKFEACFEVPEGSSGYVIKFNRAFEDAFFDLGL